MIRPIERSERAKSDLVELATYLEAEHSGTAARFLDAAEAAFSRLADFPRIGAELQPEETSHPGIRRWSVPGFRNILILYRVEANCVRVLRVVHGARDLPTLLEETD